MIMVVCIVVRLVSGLVMNFVVYLVFMNVGCFFEFGSVIMYC